MPIAVRMGGDHVTSDISKGLQVPLAVAERIKTRHGGVYATGMDDREMIEIGGDSGDWEKDRRQISRTELIGIMRPARRGDSGRSPRPAGCGRASTTCPASRSC